MTERQRRFCESFLVCGTAKQAMLEAGYSSNTAENKSGRLLRNKEVREYIDELRARRDSERVADADEVLRFLTAVMRGEEGEYVADRRGGEVTFVRRPPSLKERMRAAALLGRRYAMFTENVNIGAAPNIVFTENDIPD